MCDIHKHIHTNIYSRKYINTIWSVCILLLVYNRLKTYKQFTSQSVCSSLGRTVSPALGVPSCLEFFVDS